MVGAACHGQPRGMGPKGSPTSREGWSWSQLLHIHTSFGQVQMRFFIPSGVGTQTWARREDNIQG